MKKSIFAHKRGGMATITLSALKMLFELFISIKSFSFFILRTLVFRIIFVDSKFSLSLFIREESVLSTRNEA